MAVKLKLADLEELARSLGFEDYKSMLYEWYTVRGMGMDEIGRNCHIHYRRVRKHLTRFSISIRPRGGRHNVKIELTDELFAEVLRDGVPAVAARLGVDHFTLLMRLKSMKRPE